MPQGCPICGASVPDSPRYPLSLCDGCALLATDEDGRPLTFWSPSPLGGGVAGAYADTREPYPEHVCWVRGVTCRAQEARFGGVVIQATTGGTDQ